MSLDPFQPANRADQMDVVFNSQNPSRPATVAGEAIEINSICYDIDRQTSKCAEKRKPHRFGHAHNVRAREHAQ